MVYKQKNYISSLRQLNLLLNPTFYLALTLGGILVNIIPSIAFCNNAKDVITQDPSRENNLKEMKANNASLATSNAGLINDIENKMRFRSMWRINDHIFGDILNYSNSSMEFDEKHYTYRFEIPGYDKNEIKIEATSD